MYYIARTSYTFLPCFITLPFLLHFFISNVFSTCIYISSLYYPIIHKCIYVQYYFIIHNNPALVHTQFNIRHSSHTGIIISSHVYTHYKTFFSYWHNYQLSCILTIRRYSHTGIIISSHVYFIYYRSYYYVCCL